MSSLFVGTWFWGDKYSTYYTDRLAAGVSRHLSVPYRWRVWQPLPEDYYLTLISGCFARLRMFDPAWQEAQGIAPGDRIVSLDLDAIVTGSLDPLFARDDPFVILQGANASNPCPYNGSVFMARAGQHAEVWTSFSLAATRRIPRFDFPDDQGWLAEKIPNAAGWRAGPSSGIYAFHKPGWPKGTHDLPKDARLVVFPGWRDPATFEPVAPWIREHWRL